MVRRRQDRWQGGESYGREAQRQAGGETDAGITGLSCWPSGKASASRTVDLDLIPLFPGSIHTNDFKKKNRYSSGYLQWLPCQAPSLLGSALGLVGLMSVNVAK